MPDAKERWEHVMLSIAAHSGTYLMASGDDLRWDPDGNLFDTMNVLGADGWELVSTGIWGGEPALWFKRRLAV